MGGSKRRAKKAAPCSKELPADALSVLLTSDQIWLHEEALEGCPATVVARPAANNEQPQNDDGDGKHQTTQLLLDSWSELPRLISWFSTYILLPDKYAKLSFAPSLPKEHRAAVHTLVHSKFKQCCDSASEGFGGERYVAVVAKGQAGEARRIPQQHADHALALWLLHKEHKKKQQQQQQGRQQGQQESTQQQLAGQQQQRQAANTLPEAPASSLEALQINSNSDSDAGAVPAAAPPPSLRDKAAAAAAAAAMAPSTQHEYSRDEIAQMLMQDKLTADLSALWLGPAGVAQRWSRDICIAASAGELQEVKALLAAEPDLLAQSIPDLSSGGQLPLHLAAASGAVDVLRLLLSAGADVEAKNGAGETALQVAQRCEQCECEAILLQSGAVNKQVDGWQWVEKDL